MSGWYASIIPPSIIPLSFIFVATHGLTNFNLLITFDVSYACMQTQYSSLCQVRSTVVLRTTSFVASPSLSGTSIRSGCPSNCLYMYMCRQLTWIQCQFYHHDPHFYMHSGLIVLMAWRHSWSIWRHRLGKLSSFFFFFLIIFVLFLFNKYENHVIPSF